MGLIKLAATTSAHISAIKRTNFEAVKRHSNEFRSQTLTHSALIGRTHSQGHTHRHKSFSSIEYEKSLPFCCHICCFRFPPTAAQTSLSLSSSSSSHLGWDFLLGFWPLRHIFFPASAIRSKAANSSLILFCAWAFSVSSFHFPRHFSLFHCYFLCVGRFLPDFHVKQFPLLTYKFLKYFSKINFGLSLFLEHRAPTLRAQCKKLIKMSLKCLNF